jgi:hypothetical protein
MEKASIGERVGLEKAIRPRMPFGDYQIWNEISHTVQVEG